MANSNIKTAGIDTGKACLDAAVHGTTECWKIENSPRGWQKLAALLANAGVTRVGIEASGGYERGVVSVLRKKGVHVHLLQPIQVKAFARIHLRRAKSDALDAVLIAACTVSLDQPHRPADERLEKLARHLTFVEQIEEDIARIKIRLEHIGERRLQRMALADLARLKARRAAELKRIEQELRNHTDLAQRLDLVSSIPGIGLRTAIALIVRMPELGTLSREEAAALAGLAPYNDDSGQREGQRRIAGGRARLRRSLFAAALPAAFRWNPLLIAFYRRLTAAGKAHNAALIACARKLIVYANTVLSRGTPWLETRPAPTAP